MPIARRPKADHPCPIDLLPLEQALARFAQADRQAVEAAAHADAALPEVIRRVTVAWLGGGRLMLFGAGTSGRLAAQQAAECLPTFGLGEEAVVAVIAGGEGALLRAREGVEDDLVAGVAALAELNVQSGDVALGITASGSTPFVRGCLAAAEKQGAFTVLLTAIEKPAIHADLVLHTPTGPELVRGSSRLKAATAAKCVLDRLTTLAACGIGRVRSGHMTHMRPTNRKLRKRAERIVAELLGCDQARARQLLEENDFDLSRTLEEQGGGGS